MIRENITLYTASGSKKMRQKAIFIQNITWSCTESQQTIENPLSKACYCCSVVRLDVKHFFFFLAIVSLNHIQWSLWFPSGTCVESSVRITASFQALAGLFQFPRSCVYGSNCTKYRRSLAVSVSATDGRCRLSRVSLQFFNTTVKGKSRWEVNTSDLSNPMGIKWDWFIGA